MAFALPSVPGFPAFQPGDRFRLRVQGARTCDVAHSVAFGLVAGGYAELDGDPVAALKAGSCGSIASMRAVKRFGPEAVRLYANAMGVSDPPAKVFIDGESSNVPEAIFDALTLGPVRRAVGSGVEAAREAPGNALDAARGFASGAATSLEGIATPIGIGLAVLGIAVVIVVVVVLLRKA